MPWSVATLAELEEHDAQGNSICEAGCYRCLLSYFNQPDHDLIDRRHPRVLEILVSLANGQVTPVMAERVESDDSEWLAALSRLGLRRPDGSGVAFGDWRADHRYDGAQALIFFSDPGEATRHHAIDRDWLPIVFPADPAGWPAVFAAHPQVFGEFPENP